MKKTLKVILIVIACIFVIGLVASGIAFYTVGRASDATEYKLGDDTVKSIKTVVEKRKAVSVSTETSNGVQTKKIEYKSDAVQEDLTKYVEYLRNEEGFILTKDVDLSLPASSFQLGKESKESGQILLMTIEYNPQGYTIILQKGEGTLTRY